MKELEKLRYNSSIVELDLRLNPITKEENDYRLFLIHILPSLKILDDRSIRESERAMAATYFEPNLVSNGLNGIHNGNEKHNGYEPYQNNAVSSRVKSVTNIAKRSNGIDSDDGCDNANFHNYLNLRLNENGNGNGNADDYYLKKQQLEEYSPRSRFKLNECLNVEII